MLNRGIPKVLLFFVLIKAPAPLGNLPVHFQTLVSMRTSFHPLKSHQGNHKGVNSGYQSEV